MGGKSYKIMIPRISDDNHQTNQILLKNEELLKFLWGGMMKGDRDTWRVRTYSPVA